MSIEDGNRVTKGLPKILKSTLFKTLALIVLCLALIAVQLFFPFLYYSSPSRNLNSDFKVGVTYNYEQDDIGQIYGQVSRIHADGFKIIRVNLQADLTDPFSYLNNETDTFFAATHQFNISVAVVIPNNESNDQIQYYLSRWGKDLSYIQILNEPESSSSWAIGALYTDDEITSKFEQVYALAEPYHSNAQFYTNFGPGSIIRANIPIDLSRQTRLRRA